MNEHTLNTIRDTLEASNQGTIHFGEVIGRLVAAGVESYHVDYRSGRATCYLPEGDTVDCSLARPTHGVAEAFDGDALRAAIRGAQQGQVMYPEFKRLSQRAGCAAYTVWITGRHVVYAGRRGETHVERFPD
ncbi:MAG: hypothetical protein RI907_1532 [Pseudomonadota bacterium]|jgi:uncharacterized protein YbcV (DUF1398 family)